MWTLSFLVFVGCCVTGAPVKSANRRAGSKTDWPRTSSVSDEKGEDVWKTNWAEDAESANVNVKNAKSFGSFASINNLSKVSGMVSR